LEIKAMGNPETEIGIRLVYDVETRKFTERGSSAQGSSSRRRQFIPTIPFEWFKTVAALPGKACAVGIIARFEAAKRRSAQLKFTRYMTESVGIDRMSRQRALTTLEAAGLIQVERKSGASPMVKIVERG
jgi:hypothetical protein